MAVKFVPSISELALGASVIYTAPANTTSIVEAITATNKTGAAATVTVYLVASGGSADGTTIIIDNKNVPANSEIALDSVIGHTLITSGTIQALSDTATAVNLRTSVREIS